MNNMKKAIWIKIVITLVILVAIIGYTYYSISKI